MALDLYASVDALAAKHDGLSNADGSATLRASHGTSPGAIVTPCAVTTIAGLSDVQALGGTGLAGTAILDVLFLLSPAATVELRYAALLRWVMPAMTAALTGNTLGQPDALAGAVPTDLEVALAGDSDVYDGLPWDTVRVRYSVPFRLQAAVTP